MVKEFRNALRQLNMALDIAVKNNVPVFEEEKSSVGDFKSQQREQIKQAVKTAIFGVERESKKLFKLDDPIVDLIAAHVTGLGSAKDEPSLKKIVDKIAELTADLEEETAETTEFAVPHEIKEDIDADVQEMSKCYDAGAYRSAVILCGRILETALHRKYFELTGNDLLEKSPGIGLGNLISKISDKGGVLDPGLGNQIHLINQVRIHSVHKKQEAFQPSKEQTQAIILYTMDVLKKLF